MRRPSAGGDGGAARQIMETGYLPSMSDQPMTPSVAADNTNHRGLTAAEAQMRLKQFGPNAVVEEKAHPLRQFLRRFWAPIPWLLEATIIIQLFLGERVEAAVIGGLLVLNATVSLLQEGRANGRRVGSLL